MLCELFKAAQSMSDETKIKILVFLPKLVLFLFVRLPMTTEETKEKSKTQTYTVTQVTEFLLKKKNPLKSHTYH